MVGPAIARLFPILAVSDPCRDISYSFDFRDRTISLVAWRLNHLVITNLLNSKSGSAFEHLNSLTTEFRELIPDDKVGDGLRIAAGDSHEAMNVLIQLVKKCDIAMVSTITVRKRLEMDSTNIPFPSAELWLSHGTGSDCETVNYKASAFRNWADSLVSPS
jgi:hypothetical protein